MLPPPTLFSALTGTVVTCLVRVASAAPVGPFDAGAAMAGGFLFAFTTTKTTTITTTTKMAPDAIRIRLRRSALRAAARCAAIFSRRETSTLVLLALPMLASSNPL